jgi:hypothetical protein
MKQTSETDFDKYFYKEFEVNEDKIESAVITAKIISGSEFLQLDHKELVHTTIKSCLDSLISKVKSRVQDITLLLIAKQDNHNINDVTSIK